MTPPTTRHALPPGQVNRTGSGRRPHARILALVLVLLPACGGEHEAGSAPTTAPTGLFRDVAAESGLDFVQVSGARGKKYLPETMGGGCAFFDYDLDGDQDVLMVNSRYWRARDRSVGDPRPTAGLYRNDGAGHFEDVTVASGAGVSFVGVGVAVGDVDGDGDPDVLLTGVGGNHFLRNDGGRFTDATEEAGLGGKKDDYTTGAGFFDADGDGDLDLFVCNYVLWSKRIDDGLNFRLPKLGRVYGPPAIWEGRYCYFYRNRGDGTFEDDSERAGVRISDPAGKPVAKALGLALADLDGDGDIDVFVGNDTVRNFLFRNRGDGTFEEIGQEAGIALDPGGETTGAMGVDVGDLGADGALAIGVGNYHGEDDSLYVSRGPTTQFSDRARGRGLGVPTRALITFGFFFFDFDLDGRLDLFQTNGGLEDKGHLLMPPVAFAQPSQLFRGVEQGGKRRFELLDEAAGGDLAKPVIGRGAAYADIDADGDLDILVGQIDGPAVLLRNDQRTANHWLRLRLVGTGMNRDAIGAWVEVETAGRRQRAQVMPTRSYGSQVELPLTFGLGAATTVDAARVRWPDGTVQEISVAGVDRMIVVRKRP